MSGRQLGSDPRFMTAYPPRTPLGAVNWALLLMDGVVGVAILVVRWRRATIVRPQPAPAVADLPATRDSPAALSGAAVAEPRV
jgi:hypothetical protein